MQLHICGMSESKKKYRFLWGFYVRGFRPWHHCQKCLLGTRAEGISPEMTDGIVDLPNPTQFFYLHGYAGGPKAERGKFNLHLAVRPKAGALASAQSKYGPIFTITDAEEIEIQLPLAELAYLGDDWSRCKNLRFAAQVFDATAIGPNVHQVPVRKLK